MSEADDIKKQRDRFLAFAFASADLFLEISEEGLVTYALGASKKLTGLGDSEILGKNWLSLFSSYDQTQLSDLHQNLKHGKRCGPLLVDLNERNSRRKAVFTGIKIPGTSRFYITLALGNSLMGRLAGLFTSPKKETALSREAFIEQAKDTLDVARAFGQTVEMSLFDFTPTDQSRKRFGERNWQKMCESISAFLQSQSIDGQAAGEIGDGRYSIIHEKDMECDHIRKRIQALSQENDPTGNGVNVRSKTISAQLELLNDRSLHRALVYTINTFEREGTDLKVQNLNENFEHHTTGNTKKIKAFEDLITRLDFSLHFQPIINLKTQEVSHYEMLSRFQEGDALEWIMFGEDVGMAAAFDLAVCERAINHINFKAGGSRSKFSVNLSGHSIEDESFFRKLTATLARGKDLQERLMFEVTDSTQVEDIEKVCHFITKLQSAGYKVALDDFGTGGTSFDYLEKLKIDTVKIDGKHIRKILSSTRDATKIKNMAELCHGLGITVIAEYVEEQAQADILKDINIDFGQGHLFGKAQSAPQFVPPKK